MDDVVVMARNKKEAIQKLQQIREFLTTNLKLELNSKTQIFKSSQGVNFCGYKINEYRLKIRDKGKRMNICFIKGKIITEPEYKFTFIRNADAVIMFEIELENKSKIKVIGYNEIADKCYKELEKEDIIWIEGRIEEKQIVIKELVKNQR